MGEDQYTMNVFKFGFSEKTQSVSVNVTITSSLLTLRDEFEKRLIQLLFTRKFNNFSSTISVNPVFLSEQFSEHLLSNLTKYSFKSNQFTKGYYDSLNKDRNLFLSLTPLLECPFIKLNSSNFKITNISNDSILVKSIEITIDNHQRLVEEITDLNKISLSDDHQSLAVCSDVLEKMFADDDSDTDTDDTLYYLSLVCLSLSVVCLVMTLATYVIFPGLRTMAGKNNMALCGSLAIAQILLLVSSHLYVLQVLVPC